MISALALRHGDGSELRQPLGYPIAGGLILSQALTLFTTPVVYLFFDRLMERRKAKHVTKKVLVGQARELGTL